MQKPSSPRRTHESSSGALPRGDGRTTFEQVQADRMTDGILLAHDNGKDQVRIFPGGIREGQPLAARYIEHLDGSRTSERVGHPTLCNTTRFEDSVRPRAQKSSVESNERTRDRTAAFGVDLFSWEQHSLDMRL